MGVKDTILYIHYLQCYFLILFIKIMVCDLILAVFIMNDLIVIEIMNFGPIRKSNAPVLRLTFHLIGQFFLW